jgi:hypothetical protein
MAATWTVKVTVTEVAGKVMDVTATRTDGVDIRTYALNGLSYAPTAGRDLAAIRAEIATVVYAMYKAQADLAVATTAIASQEALLLAALNAKEV